MTSLCKRLTCQLGELSYIIVVRVPFGIARFLHSRRSPAGWSRRGTPVRRRQRCPTGPAVEAHRFRPDIHGHASKPRSVEMLRTENPLTPRTHTAGARLEPDPARVAVNRPHRFVKNSQAEHRQVGLSA